MPECASAAWNPGYAVRATKIQSESEEISIVLWHLGWDRSDFVIPPYEALHVD